MVKIAIIREATKFNEYRDYVLGKFYKSYFGDEDKILNVELLASDVVYTVQDTKTKQIRKHSTVILKKEVYVK